MFKPLAKILVPGAKVFKQARDGDAGYDIWSLHTTVVPSQGVAEFRTGIATAFDPEWVGLVLDRGGWGWKGLMRQAGVIDSNYRGEWLVKLYNTSNQALTLEGVLDNPNAKAICQAIFVQVGLGDFSVVDVLPTSVRGASGWGSSDANSGNKG
jgi:dUTP pyrophosphatase